MDRILRLLRYRGRRHQCLLTQMLQADVETPADAGSAGGHLSRPARPAVGPWCRRAPTRHRGRRGGRRALAEQSHGCGRSRRQDASARPARRQGES